MSIVFLILSFVAILLWLCFLWSRRRFYKVYWQMGGPMGLPLIGLGFQMMKPERFLQYMQEKGQEYKTPFISWMGTKCFLYVSDPETCETIFNSPHCTNKGDFYKLMAAAIGDGLFTSNSPKWNKHRRLINPAFSRQSIQTFLPIYNEETNILVSQLAKVQGQQLEIYEILKRCVLEIACQTTMGKKMNFRNDGSAAIFDAYNGITEVCIKRMLSPWLYPDVVYSFSSLFKRQQKYIDVLYKFIENLLQHNGNAKNLDQITSTMEMRPTNAVERIMDSTVNKKAMHQCYNKYNLNESKHYDDNVCIKDYIANDDNSDRIEKSKSHIFIEQVRKYVDGGQMTWQDVRDEANVIVAATFETTSTALYLVCLCLAIHPECQNKLYKELVDIFPNSKTVGFKNSDVTLDQLERMKYAEMVIDEAMRLFAPVPIVLRRASSDLRLRNGIIIPSGTQICIDIYNMHRRKDIWGPLAQTFNPEKHFSTSNKSHSFAFIPFTKGLRMCIGYRYALVLMKVMLAKLFLNFRLSTDATLQNIAVKGTISLKLCKYPLCTLHQRKFRDDN